MKGYPFEVRIPPDVPVRGIALSDQIKSLDWKVRRVERICSLSPASVPEVQDKLGALLEGD